MNDGPDSVTLPASRRLKKRIVIPTVFIIAVSGILIWSAIRGNWADSEPRNPSSSANGVVTQILGTTDGHKELRAALIVPSSPERVWKVVTDYDHFSDIFPNISRSKGVKEPDGSWHLTGQVRSIVGHWPVDVHVHHEESSGKFVASWDEPYGAWKVNRGSWVVTPHGTGETLLEYNLEVRVTPFPDFVVRAVLLDQLKPVMKSAANRVERDRTTRT